MMMASTPRACRRWRPWAMTEAMSSSGRPRTASVMPACQITRSIGPARSASSIWRHWSAAVAPRAPRTSKVRERSGRRSRSSASSRAGQAAAGDVTPGPVTEADPTARIRSRPVAIPVAVARSGGESSHSAGAPQPGPSAAVAGPARVNPTSRARSARIPNDYRPPRGRARVAWRAAGCASRRRTRRSGPRARPAAPRPPGSPRPASPSHRRP